MFVIQPRATVASKLFASLFLLLSPILLLAFSLPASAADYRPFFDQYCVSCHGAETAKAELRLDTIHAPIRDDAELAETWAIIAEMLESGEMPPHDEPQPDRKTAQQLVRWISGELARVSKPIAGLRRMTRTEYEATLHDLLGIEVPLQQYLPQESSVQGFDNVATGLAISSILMERYLEVANAAFDATIRRIKPLPPETRRLDLMENEYNAQSVALKRGGVTSVARAFVRPGPRWPSPRLDQARPIEDGIYRCRVAVWPHQPGDRTLAVALFVGPVYETASRRFMGLFDVTGTANDPRVIEFTTFLSGGETIHVLPRIYPDHLSWRDKHERQPGVAIVWAETHGPLDQDFPSQAQQSLFGNFDSLSMAEGALVYNRHRPKLRLHHIESSTPREDAERILRAFVPRAFRRPVSNELTDQFIRLTLSRLENGSTFEEAIRTGVTAVLCSPYFLLLNREAEVDDFTIASRLSYFLWSSMPDEELLQLASSGRLSDAKVRHAQVERLLNDRKSERFVRNFTGQWFDLREIESTTPDAKLYPEYDDLLLHSMLGETRGFFRHLLDNDLGVVNFVDSDFAVLNQRMASHYDIAGVRGHETFRVVPLPKDSIRGGLLTQASVLKVTANGTTTSPILRGVWVLENLLGQSVLPPPAGVPAVEPDIRGAITIRQQLAKHTTDAACSGCHARIDPPGFALEEFDAIGLHRSRYRTLGGSFDRGPRQAAYGFGPKVEAGGVLADGRKFSGLEAFRSLLLEDPDRIARTTAVKLLVYGCGRPLTRADQESVDDVMEAARKNNFGLRSMIHAVVETELFHRP